MKKILLGLLLGFAAIFSACEKKIEIPVNDLAKQLVVEGYVFDTVPPYYVWVQRSAANYFGENKYDAVGNCIITITDNMGQHDTLREVQGFTGLYQTQTLQGIPNRKYDLYVKTPQGEIATASSYMPGHLDYDALIVEYINKENSSVLYPEGYYVSLVGKDPDTLGNNYRVLFYENDTMKKEPQDYFSWDDKFINGNLLVQRMFYTLQKGDTARVDLWSMDKPSLEYYYSLTRQLNGGGPFSPPGGNIYTNMNGALGFFGAFSVSSKSIIIE